MVLSAGTGGEDLDICEEILQILLKAQEAVFANMPPQYLHTLLQRLCSQMLDKPHDFHHCLHTHVRVCVPHTHVHVCTCM